MILLPRFAATPYVPMDFDMVMMVAERNAGRTSGSVMLLRICTLLAPWISPISSSSELIDLSEPETMM